MLFEYLVLRGLTLTLILYLFIKICNPDIKHMFTAVFLKSDSPLDIWNWVKGSNKKIISCLVTKPWSLVLNDLPKDVNLKNDNLIKSNTIKAWLMAYAM